MNINDLFKIQQAMEQLIVSNSEMSEDSIGTENLYNVRFLALQIKLGTLANLTKCYKYMHSSDYLSQIPRDKLMLAYIDTLKQLLSIGIKYEFNIISDDVVKLNEEDDLIRLFSKSYSYIERVKYSVKRDNYIDSLNDYLRLLETVFSIGSRIGLKFEEVYEFYQKIK